MPGEEDSTEDRLILASYTNFSLKSMKKLWLAAFLALLGGILAAQSKYALGLAAGTSWYMGDLNPSKVFNAPSPAAGFFLLYNINKRYGVRTEFSYLTIRSAAVVPNTYYFSKSFSTGMMNIDSRFEFNFEPFGMLDRKKIYTTFVDAGLGYSYAFASPARNFVYFPFGVGMKVGLSRKLGVGCEWETYKTFTDRLDGVENPGSLHSSFMNNDWFSFFNVFVIFRIFDGPADCPAYQD